MTYAAVAALATDATFRTQLTVAIVAAATEIGNAVIAMESPSGIDKFRYVLATAVIADPLGYVETFAWPVAAALGPSPADSDVKFWVESSWNLVAKVPV
jgi:hypothetical protein